MRNANPPHPSARRQAPKPASPRPAVVPKARAAAPPPGPAIVPRTREAAPPPRPGRERADNWLYGRHAVVAALANPERRWRRLLVLPGMETEAAALAGAARATFVGRGAAMEVLDRAAVNLILPDGAVHQGWALEAVPLERADLDDVLRGADGEPGRSAGRSIIVVLDQITDPHNVGAVLRSAAAFGAAAVIVAEHGAPPVTGTLAKAASGALEHVPLVRAVNLSRALDRLKAAGYWCCGLEESAAAPLAGLDLGARVVLVLGSEGGGLRRLVREHCDFLARLPTLPALPSLNVSNATAIALYEMVRGGPAS